ncbi:hypothetical protein LT350_33740 [Mycolicibacterium smegmatis]|uniref:hypothetical protein n=1 Tax=Mycolicibacterium smegmatis TaxID=1772 RepID=UPI001E326936|nr:hypothetical protein [Mycolicibacterium smegmatis]UGU31386.1 hypothetical protein LT350_33740 [Mycolicibacterium smegmatis]ULN72280.1 hypothetical protein KZ782_10485 [Mycolicibacterium smegmatis]
MSTFAPPQSLYERIRYIHLALKRARRERDKGLAAYAEKRLNELLDRVQRRPLHDIDPELDARLRVDFQ